MSQSPSPKKIYDCFIFYNELDLLEIRLNELYKHVDHFVICEATMTFQGRPKPLIFAENRERYAAFADKIIHLVVDDMPADGDAWDRETHQRNALRRALGKIGSDDIVMISDVDEMFSRGTVEHLRQNEGYFRLHLDMYQFYMNMYSGAWSLPFAYSWFLEHDIGDYTSVRIEHDAVVQKFADAAHEVYDAGWHFTFLGGADKIRTKLAAYSHDDRWQRNMQAPGAAERQLTLLLDVGGGMLLRYREVDERFPQYVQDNLSALIAAGLVKDPAARLSELEDELAHFLTTQTQSAARERYKDVELDRVRAMGIDVNLALGKPALQSSVPDWLFGGSLHDANYANNGSIPEPGAWAFHTDHERDPWWQVDLEVECEVSEVAIVNRQEYSERLAHFSLLKSSDGLHWTTIFQKTDDDIFSENPYVVRFDNPEIMRFLRVRLDGEDFLHFTQCMVYGRPSRRKQRLPLQMGTIAVGRKPVAEEPVAELEAEAVRLVIWDLDETFWKGTLTEGGITEYIQANHDAVIALAKRGIMSSICSKNDLEPVAAILKERGLWDYFIFPSISWDSKGPRLARLIEQVQLRPASVLFIDDNLSNLAEAAAHVPGLQLADETFIPQILSDRRFAGKDDDTLARLAQYKLLEARKDDETQSGDSNEAFLRGCDIRVQIEYDVLPHIDRAVELINRTNQLNFTKVRLPEDAAEARAALTRAISDRNSHVGLVRVVDKYGDYGFVGFFLLREYSLNVASRTVTRYLEHYCFSCRTLGMLVERWLYDLLGRPYLEIAGEVLTDLNETRAVDWIRLASSIEGDGATAAKIAPEIRIHGGCEIAPIAHYLETHTDRLVVTGNFFAGASFVRANGASLLLSACDRAGPEFDREAAGLGIPAEVMTNRYLENPPEGTLFIFGGQYDAGSPPRYRHKVHGWEMRIEPYGFEPYDLTVTPEDEVAQKLAGIDEDDKTKAEIGSLARHIRENYVSVECPEAEVVAEAMHALIARIPAGSKLVLILDDPRVRHDEGIEHYPNIVEYNARMTKLAAQYPFVGVARFSDCIRGEDEIEYGGNHYGRLVYCRMADSIMAVAGALEARGAVGSTAATVDSRTTSHRAYILPDL